MSDKLRENLHGLSGFATSALGVITANQEQIEWWLRCGASLIAIVAGCYSVYSMTRKPNA